MSRKSLLAAREKYSRARARAPVAMPPRDVPSKEDLRRDADAAFHRFQLEGREVTKLAPGVSVWREPFNPSTRFPKSAA